VTPAPRISFARASVGDAPGLVVLYNAVARHLTERYGKGHWSSETSERGVLSMMRTSAVIVGRSRGRLIATFRLATKKPWAIDVKYFTPCTKPLYLLNMAVEPARQRHGVGRRCLDEAMTVARAWPADAIRLDAYDAAAGAGDFYRMCGFREVGRASYRQVPLIYFEITVPFQA